MPLEGERLRELGRLLAHSVEATCRQCRHGQTEAEIAGHLACLARLHGIDAVSPGECNVLELGCASGGNLIPMAARLPNSRFLGIELSPEQAQEGADRVTELGLGNCEIRQANILDVAAASSLSEKRISRKQNCNALLDRWDHAGRDFDPDLKG